MTQLDQGKLTNSLMDELLHDLPVDSGQRIPPGMGLDAGVVRHTGRYLGVAVDPITFETQRPARFSLAVNLNDAVCQGIEPRWYAGSFLLPPGTTEDELRELWRDYVDTLEEFGITPVAGHTEVTDAVKRPVLSGQIHGPLLREEPLDPRKIQPGDQILQWRPAALEAAAIVSGLVDEEVDQPEEGIRYEWSEYLEDPGITVWPEAREFIRDPSLLAAHDPTEGGIATALHELADAAKRGLEVDREAITFPPGMESFCEGYSVDPLGIISSGCLLLVVPSGEIETFRDRQDEEFHEVAQFTRGTDRLLQEADGVNRPLPRFDQDQLIPLEEKLSDGSS